MCKPSRRNVLQGAAAIAGGTLLPSCAHTSSGPPLPPAPTMPGGLKVEGTRFVKNGKPFFFAGPHDTLARCRQIVTILANTCGEGNFDFVIPQADPGFFDDPDDELEEWDDDPEVV